MKFNKWTLGLAALGVVSLSSAARADEAKLSPVQTALSNTTLSGYVDTSIQWNPSGGASVAPVAFQNSPQGIVGSSTATSSKANGFNLNVIDLALDKPQDEGPWAAGYHVELWFGQDATTLGTSGQNSLLNNNGGGALGNDVAIRQAYISLRTPVGNGIDWKLGVFDTIIGYESTSSPLNPNYTRSYGYSMEPSSHTGLLATYKFCDAFSVTAGIADSKGPVMNDHSPQTVGGASDSFKTYMGSVTLTAPQSWGWANGATLSGGVINGDFSNTTGGSSDASTSWYVGGTLPTPNSNLKLGASFDYLTDYQHPGFGGTGNPWALAGYVNFQATPKLSLNGRAEWAKNYLSTVAGFTSLPSEQNAVALTGTVQYNLWANVLTRVEFRWDHASHDIYGGNLNGSTASQSYVENAIMVALQAVYQF
ncbi:MAG: outer membrane beta-barrel protein [Limisphaerales bacterium]